MQDKFNKQSLFSLGRRLFGGKSPAELPAVVPARLNGWQLEGEVIRLIENGRGWPEIAQAIQAAEPGAAVNAIVVAEKIGETRRFELLPELVQQVPEDCYRGIILATLYPLQRSPDYKPESCLPCLDAMYNAFTGSPGRDADGKAYVVWMAEQIAMREGAEDCFDWALRKPEFRPMFDLGLVVVARRENSTSLARKMILSGTSVDAAIETLRADTTSALAPAPEAALERLLSWRKAFAPKPPQNKLNP